jgi:hypothetical protein
LRGTGWRIHQAFRYRPDCAEQFIAACAARQRADLLAGWNEARALDRLE